MRDNLSIPDSQVGVQLCPLLLYLAIEIPAENTIYILTQTSLSLYLQTDSVTQG